MLKEITIGIWYYRLLLRRFNGILIGNNILNRFQKDTGIKFLTNDVNDIYITSWKNNLLSYVTISKKGMHEEMNF